jgi:hypothetical protein
MHYLRMYRNGSLSKKEGHVRKTGYKYFAKFKKFEHVIVAEKALGKPLPKCAVVHHFNEAKADNSPTNLVVCPSQKYHMLLHHRMKALAACGNPDWRPCHRCSKHDAIANMYFTGKQYRHRSCEREYHQSWKANKMAMMEAKK